MRELSGYLSAAISPEWAESFYREFFALCPEVVGLFHGNPEAQAEKFAATLIALISAEEASDQLEAELVDLGRRHVAYGVKPHHYEFGFQALLLTVQRANPDHWSPAWDAEFEHLYRSVLARMQVTAAVGH